MRPRTLATTLGIITTLLVLGSPPLQANAEEPTVPYVENIGDEFDFTSGQWKGALLINRFLTPGAFRIMGKAFANESPVSTEVYLLRTADALHLGIICNDNDGLARRGAGAKSNATVPAGNTMEIFIDGNLNSQQAYYQLIVNPAGDCWLAAAGEERPLGKIECKVQQDSDAWKIKVRIPYDEIGIDRDADEIRANFFRNYRSLDEEEPANHSTWEGTGIASFNQLRPLKLSPAEMP